MTKRQRIEHGEEILDNPQRYKMCLGCESILHRRTNLCPRCRAYRFDGKRKTVTMRTEELIAMDYEPHMPDWLP